MKKSQSKQRKLVIASSEKTDSEIYSIVLKGVIITLKSIFNGYYVSDNIEGLLNYINDKKVIGANEYKRLLNEAKDFYPVIICAIMLRSLRKHTMNFRYKELALERKKTLFIELRQELTDFFMDWLCSVDINPLLIHRVAAGYKINLNLQLFLTKQIKHSLTDIEENILKGQLIEIITVFLIEQVSIHLGIVGLDYLDYYDDSQLTDISILSSKEIQQISKVQSLLKSAVTS